MENKWTAIYFLGYPVALCSAILLRLSVIDLGVALTLIFIGMIMIAVGLYKA